MLSCCHVRPTPVMALASVANALPSAMLATSPLEQKVSAGNVQAGQWSGDWRHETGVGQRKT